MPIDHDRLFKELLSTFFVEFIDLFFPDLGTLLDRSSLTFLDKELFSDVTAGEQFEADLVVKARLQQQDSYFLVHVENQSEAQSHFSYRMFRYFARLYEKHQLPIYPIAVFSFDTPLRAQPASHRVELVGFTVLEFHYRVIQLNRLPWRDYLQQPNPVAGALMAKMNMTPAERARVKLECLRLVASLKLDRARMRLISGFVDTYLRLTREEELRFAEELARIAPTEREQVVQIVTSWLEAGRQEGLEAGRQEGRQEGRQGGRQEGRQEGRQQEALTIVLRQLGRRVGELSEATRQRLERLSVGELEELGESLLDFAGTPDLDAWLSRHDL